VAQAVEITGLQEITHKLGLFVGRLGPETEQALFEGAELVRTHMVETYLTSGPLYVGKTGRLRGGWRPQRVPGTLDAATVILGTRVKYARVHNYGFSGPVWVKEHLRRPGQRRRLAPVRGTQAKLRRRGEVRRKREAHENRERRSRAAHGVGVRKQQQLASAARRMRGLQGNIEPLSGRLDGGGGLVQVRAHGRFMKIRGHLYLERSVRDKTPAVLALLTKRLARGFL